MVQEKPDGHKGFKGPYTSTANSHTSHHPSSWPGLFFTFSMSELVNALRSTPLLWNVRKPCEIRDLHFLSLASCDRYTLWQSCWRLVGAFSSLYIAATRRWRWWCGRRRCLHWETICITLPQWRQTEASYADTRLTIPSPPPHSNFEGNYFPGLLA